MSEQSTEEEILTAAGDVLATRGYDGFTTANVAEEANVSQGLVHHYFETKNDLLRRLFEYGSQDVATEIAARAGDGSPRDRLVAVAEYLVRGGDNFDEALDVARLSIELRHRAMYDDDIRWIFDRDRSPLVDLVAETVQDGIDAGQFRDIDPHAFAEVYLGAIEAGEQLRAIFGDPDATEPMFYGLRDVVDTLLLADSNEPGPRTNEPTP